MDSSTKSEILPEINKIYNEDCLTTMAKMPDDFVNLVVTCMCVCVFFIMLFRR